MGSRRSDRKNSTSRFISLILRHKPDAVGITLDEHGWLTKEVPAKYLQKL